jgi:SAM-dependent methyltransferase
VTLEQAQRITALQTRYQVQFEQSMTAATALNNYEYLDILDRAWGASGSVRPQGGVLCDIGCASFWYAAAMAKFFAPHDLVGVEIEGHRLFRDGHTRIDYAAGYLSRVAGARFIVADYGRCELPADVILAWFPFVTPAAVLAWRLPLSVLAPDRLFARVHHNLRPDGIFVMVNHGEPEARLAETFCVAAGLIRRFGLAQPGILSARRESAAILSCWSRA